MKIQNCKRALSVPLFGLLLFLLFTIISLATAQKTIKIAPELTKLVADFNSNAKITEKADIDTFCYSVDYPLVSNPGIVEADFNGDKKTDYAVLLQLGKPFDTVSTIDGEQLKDKKMKMTLVAFISKGDGKFKTVSLMEKHLKDSNYPLNFYIEEQPPGSVKEFEGFDSNKEVYLENPGILLIFCESSAVVIYWDKKTKRFDEIWVSD